MIYGIGIDMVQISRIEAALERWGDRFVRRVFTQSEIEHCQKRVHPASRFALRFAAKEAFAKALGLGFRQGLSFRQIEVIHDTNGRPNLGLHHNAKKIYEQHGIQESFLSLSDDGRYAVAVVVLEV